MRVACWVVSGLLVGGLGTVSAQAKRQEAPKLPDSSEIPDSAKALRNPLAASDATLKAGRILWRAHCETCHGVAGRGDGPNARLHEMRKSVAPQDLTDPALQEALSDGELFWRITHGIVDGDNVIMPAYGAKIPGETQRWQVVVFVRALGRGTARK